MYRASIGIRIDTPYNEHLTKYDIKKEARIMRRVMDRHVVLPPWYSICGDAGVESIDCGLRSLLIRGHVTHVG